jgi:hypothetical protein
MLEGLVEKGFQVAFRSHARAILAVDFPEATAQLESVLTAATIPIEEIVGSGGGETKGTQRLRRSLHARAWRKHKFVVGRTIDGVEREAVSHEIDHIARFEAGTLALEIEWNNKDPFFDRDLENFKRLHAEGAISVGILVTRGVSLQDGMRALVRRFAEERQIGTVADLARLGLRPTRRQLDDYARRGGGASFARAWSDSFVQDKFGAATTHWRKLEDRVQRGVGNPCPLLLIGLPAAIVTFGAAAPGTAARPKDGELLFD